MPSGSPLPSLPLGQSLEGLRASKDKLGGPSFTTRGHRCTENMNTPSRRRFLLDVESPKTYPQETSDPPISGLRCVHIGRELISGTTAFRLSMRHPLREDFPAGLGGGVSKDKGIRLGQTSEINGRKG